MGNRKKLPHHEELTRLRVMTENQFTEKKLLRPTMMFPLESSAIFKAWFVPLVRPLL
jgi:hypothetical protein